jgi:hypothetical protein
MKMTEKYREAQDMYLDMEPSYRLYMNKLYSQLIFGLFLMPLQEDRKVIQDHYNKV